MAGAGITDSIAGVLPPVTHADPHAARAVGEALRSAAVVAGGAEKPGPTTWTGSAAQAYTHWGNSWRADLDTVTATLTAASRVLDDIAEVTAAAISRASQVQSEYTWAQTAGDLTTAERLRSEHAVLVDRQAHAEATAAAHLHSLTAGLPGDPHPICHTDQEPPTRWTEQQTRDAVRGIGDAAWGTGPGTVTALLRWGGPIGWAGGWDWAAHAEEDAKQWLDAWGGGRTDTLTNGIAYGTTATATVLIPGPSGKFGIAEWGGSTIARYFARLAGKGWHGERGLHLTPKQVQAVAAFYDRALAAEPSITVHMNQILRHIHQLSAHGRQYVLKNPESLNRKVADDLKRLPRVRDVLNRTNDAVRYTFVAPDESYAAAVNAATSAIAGRGYLPVKWRNAWEGSTYVGINSVWRDPVTGLRFEVQLHTPTSYWAKEFTHPIYRMQRILREGSRPWKRLREAQAEIFSGVPHPSSSNAILDPTRRLAR